jgi:hypothetical protein
VFLTLIFCVQKPHVRNLTTTDISTGQHRRRRWTVDPFDIKTSPPMAFTIAEFCDVHRISQAAYFKQRKLGFGPREIEFGRRRLISAEAAAEWRRERAAANEAAAINPNPR